MPTRQEMIPNKPLSGVELKQLIKNDVEAVLDRDGMFREHMGYARVGYKIHVQLQLENPSYPEHNITITSRKPTKQETQTGDPHRATSTFPLDPPPDIKAEESVLGMERQRQINSPNQARLENDMPVTAVHRDQKTGHVVESKVHVTQDGLNPVPPKDRDTTKETAIETGAKERLERKGKQVTVVE